MDRAKTPVTRFADVASRLGCGGQELVALAVLVSGALLVALLLWWGGPHPPGTGGSAAEVAGRPSASPALGAVSADQVVVHVAGQVVAPGLYDLPGGARVADALSAAGGPLPDATLDAVNLARPLRDGEQLIVPAAGAVGEAVAGATATTANGAVRADGRLDLNRASAAELEELPGIGPVLAERIVEHREEHGGFAALSDLRAVPGIGEARFQELSELVAV